MRSRRGKSAAALLAAALFAVAFLIYADIAARAETLTPRAFAEAFAAAARTTIPKSTVTVTGDLSTATRIPGGEVTTSDLHNAFAAYREHPDRLDDIIRKYVGVLAEAVTFHPNSVDRSRILPVIKSRQWADGVLKMQRAQAGSGESLIEPLNSELVIAYAEDTPTAIRYLTTKDDVGDRAKLRPLAQTNLYRSLNKIGVAAVADGIFLIKADGTYEPSLILVDEIWTGNHIKLDGDPVVAVPAKGALLVTGSNNAAGLKRLRVIAAELAAGPYGVSAALFVRRDGKFEVLGP